MISRQTDILFFQIGANPYVLTLHQLMDIIKAYFYKLSIHLDVYRSQS